MRSRETIVSCERHLAHVTFNKPQLKILDQTTHSDQPQAKMKVEAQREKEPGLWAFCLNSSDENRDVEFGPYQLGRLRNAREYNFFRDEDSEELNPCKVFCSRDATGDCGYTVVPHSATLENGKMRVGSVLICAEAKTVLLMRYNPDRPSWARTHPTSELCHTELFGWDQFVCTLEPSMRFAPGRLSEIPGFDAMPVDVPKMHLRGSVLKAMAENLKNLRLMHTSIHETVLRVNWGAEHLVRHQDLSDSLYYTVLLKK